MRQQKYAYISGIRWYRNYTVLQLNQLFSCTFGWLSAFPTAYSPV